MAFQDIWQSAKRFFGPDNSFFHGPQEDSPAQPQMEEMPAPQVEMPSPEQSYQQPAYQQPQMQYQPQYQQSPYQAQYQQPQPQQYQQPQPQPQQQNPFQQGYRPPQPPQPTVDPYIAPRNRRSAQHQQQMPQSAPQQVDASGNVVPFPGAAPSAAPAQKSANACVINVRSIADCRNAIGILRSSDCVIAVMDSIADQAEIRRYVDTLNGACFSLGCTMTRLSARVGVYLLAPAGMNVYTDQATTQMNSQSRAPQRAPQRPAQPQQAFRPPYQQPQQGYQPMQQGYPQSQQAAPVFSAQSPAQGYSPDMNENEYNAI